MRAVIYNQPLPINHSDSLMDIELPAPQPGADDLLATNLKRAHALIESGGSRGKVVLAGFDGQG